MDIQPPPDTNYFVDVFLPIGLVVAGGAIGFVSALLLSWRQRRHEQQQKSGDERRSYKAWLTGLRAELNHIQTVIREITEIIESGQPSTKRINSDFLREARLVIFKHDEDTSFLEELTTAFRDIVHTNEMLNRLERVWSVGDQTARANTLLPVSASMEGVAASTNTLSTTLDKKLNTL